MTTEQTTPQAEVPAPPPPRPIVTQEIVTSRFSLELTKSKYQEALQALTSYQITEDNINDAQEKMKKARAFLKKFDDIKSNGKEEALAECRYWDAAFKSLKEPFEKLITEKNTKLMAVASEIERKRKEKELEDQRIKSINDSIDNFILSTGTAIAEATKDDQLVAIEKLIGSHKANKSRYQEFLPDLVTRCNDLTPILKKQKEAVRKMEELRQQEQDALTSGDDAKVLEMREQQEVVQSSITENKVLIQETAINQATAPSITTVEAIAPTVSARRTTWKAELLNDQKSKEKAFKAGMLDCELNSEAVKTTLKTLKDTGALKGLTEYTLNGIRFYEEKLF